MLGRSALAVAVVVGQACAFDPAELGGSDGGSVVLDAGADGGDVDDTHLLLTEVRVGPTGFEYIEIFNPRQEAVELDFYYLTDSRRYPLLPGGESLEIGLRDFLVQFPSSSIGAGEVALIAIEGVAFEALVGVEPDYAILEPGSSAPMIRTEVGTLPSISDDGEGLVLFYWDGATDLVADVDMMVAGSEPSGSNDLVNKSGISVDGPDADGRDSRYKRDVYTIGDLQADSPLDLSFQRVRGEADAFEEARGGNGLTGHDETSEAIRTSWTIAEPTPGEVAAELR